MYIMQRVIEPEEGRVLVRLETSEYGAIPVPEKTYDSVTSGTILSINPKDKDKEYLVGRKGYWKLYMDDLRVGTLPTGEKLALILISNIEGTSRESD